MQGLKLHHLDRDSETTVTLNDLIEPISYSVVNAFLNLNSLSSSWSCGEKQKTVGYHERHHRMRCDPGVICHEHPVEPEDALVLHHFPEAIKHAIVGQHTAWESLLLLQSSLHEVKRKTDERGKESCNSGSGQSLRLRR